MRFPLQATLFGLIAVALVAIELLRGGTRTVLALPAYAILAFAACLTVFHARRTGVSRQGIFCLVSAVVFFGYLFVRSALSSDAFLARTNLYLIGASLILYLLSAFHVTRSGLRLALVAVLLVLGLAHCGVGAVQFFEGKNYTPFDLLPRPDYGSRASGFYNSPNHLAGFLEAALLMGISVAWWSRWPTYGKILAGYAAVMCLGGLLITGSRGGYLGTSCGLLFFLLISLWIVMKRVPERRWMLLLAIGVFTLVLGLGLQKALTQSHLLEERAASMVQQEEGGLRRLLGVRQMMGRAALQQFLLSPALGTGAGTYLYYGRQFRARTVQRDPIYAHNDYLQLLAEYGVVGLVGLFIFLNVHLRNGWRWVNHAIAPQMHAAGVQSNSLALTIGAICSVVAYMAHSILDFNLQIPANALLVAFLFGLLANPEGEAHAPSLGSGRIIGLVLRFAPAGLGVWMLWVALAKLPAEVWGEKARRLLSTSQYLESAEVARNAEEYARQGAERDPGNTELHSMRGDAQVALAMSSGEPSERQRWQEESAGSFTRALKLSPQDRNIVLGLAWSLDALQRFDESEPLFQRALQLDPNAADVRWAHAAHLHARGKLEEAEAQYKVAIRLGSRAAQIGLERLATERK